MEKKLKEILLAECNKHITRYNRKCDKKTYLAKNFEKMTGQKANVANKDSPAHWSLHKHFNPFYVRKHARSIAKAITKKIRDGTYTPLPCVTIKKNKEHGTRTLTIFSIPDAAVAKILNRVLQERNNSLLSPSAFAYRIDRNAHDAIEKLSRGVKQLLRYYILQYDFRKYFETVEHAHLIQVLTEHHKVSKKEIELLRAFIGNKSADFENYREGKFTVNSLGIPQGCAVSMFLANVACYTHDKMLEHTGVDFVRYSDDTVVICDSYEKANECFNLAYKSCEVAGMKINERKSKGIALMAPKKRMELTPCIDGFDFLGHHIGYKVGLKQTSIKRIKQHVSSIINRFLIYYAKEHGVRESRYSSNIDWDLVRCINKIRKYIYGSVTEQKLNSCLANKDERLVFTRSVMSYYPLVGDGNIFKELDGWLVDTLYYALKVRAEMVSKYIPSYVYPGRHELITGSWYVHTIANETKLPSFFKSWIYMRKLASIYSLSKFPNPEYY